MQIIYSRPIRGFQQLISSILSKGCLVWLTFSYNHLYLAIGVIFLNKLKMKNFQPDRPGCTHYFYDTDEILINKHARIFFLQTKRDKKYTRLGKNDIVYFLRKCLRSFDKNDIVYFLRKCLRSPDMKYKTVGNSLDVPT